MVRIGLLGGVRAATDDGRPIDIGPAKSQTVLAALALSPGAPLAVSRLVELVWGDAPPRTAYKTLQWHVARLRKGLGSATIVRVGAAYRLDVAPDAVDVTRFQRHLREGDLAAALAQWGGPPLAGLDAPGLAAAVAGLTEQWLSAVEADLERRVESDPRGVIGPLAELAERHPLREGFCALLMTALYRAGRQADALAAFRRARHHLVTQLGVEPGPALRELESRILDHDERLRGRAVPEHAPPRRPSGTVTFGRLTGTRRGYLPHGVGRLIGRDRDLRAAADALARSPIVTLVGPGGIGKTQLALAAARTAAAGHGSDGWLIELAEITSPADVPRAVADVLGVAQRPGHTLTQSIVAVLRSRRALLVIDNCEHVIDGAAKLVQAIVAGCPQVRVLATARERLAVAGEQVLVVEPLDPAAGTELFHARALAADRTYDADAHHRHVEEICRRLDGIPLAIELAAARTMSHRPVDLVARLDDRLRATGGRRTGAARHRTLRAAIQWSYDLLTPAEKTLFQRLSVFNAPFDLSAAEAVSDEQDVDDLLGDLVERSMVTVAFGPSGRRFRLLETMRQFAAEHLREHGHTDLAAGRHARWCLREVTHIHRLLTGPGEIEGVARLGDLWANLRAAVTWACAAGDPRLADALVRPVVTELPLRGRQEIGVWAEHILATTPAEDQEDQDLRAFWLVWVAERYTQNANQAGYRHVADRRGEPARPLSRYAHAYASGDGEALRRHLPDAVTDLRRQDEQYLAAFLEMTSAGPLLGIGRFEQVDTSVSALADRYRTHGPPTLLHWALQTLGYSASFQGRHDEADRYFDEAARVDVPAGALSANKTTEARSAFRRGDRPRAFQLLRSHIDELIDTDNVIAASVVCIEFINMMAAIDRIAEAARMLGYLEAANDFGALAARTLVTEAADKIAASVRHSSDPTPASVRHIDDRAALVYMRDVLVGLARPGAQPETSAS
ncbi:BTAD domain-containing putative transcriptional regulator [Nonomuraea basaltis]|uniref:BTAD domain-containing putative transcriptional regulator n=1 Tax=Nonomuraea basaltis TaxID=2495887 RepID=UPI00110C4DD3|nr:BTAD domain-containing putative transcriptional regulator [Nonomuraea basaltis]TMR94767.1 AfsR/SARP family transcriptional regulator [Nonomuraea basaltis]